MIDKQKIRDSLKKPRPREVLINEFIDGVSSSIAGTAEKDLLVKLIIAEVLIDIRDILDRGL